jgi:periplasmic protein TonB
MSELGTLSQCLVDSDGEALERARRLRRKAVVISVAGQAVVVAAMLILPLVTPGELPRQFNITPAPPFPGNPATRSEHRALPPATRPRIPQLCLALCAPEVTQRRFPESGNPEPPSIDSSFDGSGDNIPGAIGSGPGIPGATGNRPIVLQPPEQPVHHDPVRMSEGVMEAMLIRRPQPSYPPLARAMHLSGTVILRATIATDGTVHSLVVVSGHPILAQAAVAAVRDWRYRPTLLSGQPVEVETEITVKFVLE